MSDESVGKSTIVCTHEKWNVVKQEETRTLWRCIRCDFREWVDDAGV